MLCDFCHRLPVPDAINSDSFCDAKAPPQAPLSPFSTPDSMPVLHQSEGRFVGRDNVMSVEKEFECRIIRDFAQLKELATAWERLWRSDPNAEVFQQFTWARAWWQSFGSHFKLCVPVVYEGSQVSLILPLVERRGTLQFLGSPQSDYSDMLCCHPRPEWLLAIALEALLRSAPEWKECILGDLRPDSHIVRAWGELPSQLRRRLQLGVTHACPTILLGEKREEVIDSLLAGKHMRRRLQKLQKAGVVSFRHIESEMEAQQQLTHFFQCHRRRCAVFAKISCFEEPEMRSMTRTLVAQLDLRRELRLGVLELNGRPVAWSLGFQANGKYAYYQQTFDLDAEEYAPGEVLLHYLLSYAKESVEREFDFLRGDEFFKRRFAAQVNQCRTVYFQRPGIRGRMRGFQRSAQGRLRGAKTQIESFVRTHENVFHVLRSFWTWNRNVSRRLRWANNTGELTDYLLASCMDLFRRAVWSKHRATLFQLEDGKGLTVLPACLTSDARISITTGRLSDLADLALEHPEISLPGFREYRNRLKRGDQVHLVRQNNELTLVAWTGVRPITELSTIAHASPTGGGKVAVAMYECWPILNPGVGCTQLLALLAAEASKGKLGLLVCCPALPTISSVELEARGFLPVFRIIGHRILRWFRHDSVRDGATLDEQPSAHDGLCPKLKKR
jgi:CelD/BcsL family acetyltransferase involved in cellulose biosynthesis